MSFSAEWEKAYQENSQMSIWPWSDLVTYVMRYSRPDGPKFSVLEIGCGAGANIPFFESLNVRYYAVDGSESIIKNVKERYPKIAGRIKCADFTEEIPFDEKFDLIVDRASLTHNHSEVIRECLEKVISPALKPQGKFIGIDWFSTAHSDFSKGERVDGDQYTMKDYPDGQFGKLGVVHFTDKEHLLKLFKGFNITNLEHKIHEREIPKDGYIFASWNFAATKL